MTGNLTETIHATLVQVFAVGVLITGESGSGKSECSLELISRGHVLVADDVVELTRVESTLYGSAPQKFRGLLKIRDVGICDVQEIFGNGSVVDRCEIGISLALRRTASEETDRISENRSFVDFIDVSLPHFEISNSAARPLPLIIEAIVKTVGSSAAATLIQDHDRAAAG